jgi:hypothetical protein
MLDTLRRFLKRFMSNQPPTADSLFPRTSDDVPVSYWSNKILSGDVTIAKSCFLTQLDHCKVANSPRHEFLLASFTLQRNSGENYRTCVIIDRCPAPNVEEKPAVPKTASTSSLISPSTAASSRTASPSPYSPAELKAYFGNGGSIPAKDHVVVPSQGQLAELLDLATQKFGKYDILNTLSIHSPQHSMSASQIAILLDVIHNLAPDYTLNKHQCYWFALIIFLVIRSQVRGTESHGALIVQRGKLFGLSPEHSAGDDEMVAEEEYKKAWDRFKVGRC